MWGWTGPPAAAVASGALARIVAGAGVGAARQGVAGCGQQDTAVHGLAAGAAAVARERAVAGEGVAHGRRPVCVVDALALVQARRARAVVDVLLAALACENKRKEKKRKGRISGSLSSCRVPRAALKLPSAPRWGQKARTNGVKSARRKEQGADVLLDGPLKPLRQLQTKMSGAMLGRTCESEEQHTCGNPGTKKGGLSQLEKHNNMW